ncbi:MAG: hypothetical protein FD123_3099 [Bacteroidetes bacterium]|nr:MAG: hypothetical protein FD123_3099 [Bacteroidota bacterium]
MVFIPAEQEKTLNTKRTTFKDQRIRPMNIVHCAFDIVR